MTSSIWPPSNSPVPRMMAFLMLSAGGGRGLAGGAGGRGGVGVGWLEAVWACTVLCVYRGLAGRCRVGRRAELRLHARSPLWAAFLPELVGKEMARSRPKVGIAQGCETCDLFRTAGLGEREHASPCHAKKARRKFFLGRSIGARAE